MATADQYADWIVKNEAKKGTPEFETVAEAYRLARQEMTPESFAQIKEEGNVKPPPPMPPEPPITDAKGLMRGLAVQGFDMMRPGSPGMGISHLLEQGASKAGEFVNDNASKVMPPESAAALGTTVNVGLNALPLVVGGGAAGAVARPAAEGTAKFLMHSALKPGGVKRIEDAERVVQGALDEGLNTTRGGINKGWEAVRGVDNDISNAISNSTATIDNTKAAGTLAETLRKFERQATPRSDRNAIQDVWTEILQEHPKTMPVQLAQELKQGTYTVLKGKYGEQGSASVEAQKRYARALKDEIATAVPEVTALNARESALLATLPAIERRVIVEGNRNPAGLALLISNPKAAAAFMADKSSAFKSIMARMIYQASKDSVSLGAGAGLAESLREQSQQ